MVEVGVTDEFVAWYEELSVAHTDSVAAMIAKLEQFGTQLPFPSSSALKGSKYALRELRIKAQGAQIRIAYAFDPKREAILIIGGVKQGDDRFYEWLVPDAEKIWEQYLREQGHTP